MSAKAWRHPLQTHSDKTQTSIPFLALAVQEAKTFVDFKVKRAYRAKVEKALARVEILAKDGMNYGGGRWPLSAEPKGDEEVLSYELNRMTLESIRKTL